MKKIKKVKPKLLEKKLMLVAEVICPHCGVIMVNVDKHIISMLCLGCGNPIKLMWENKIK